MGVDKKQAEAAAPPRTRDRTRTGSDLKLAWHRLVKGNEKVSIAAVAREAGVTPALIHNKYPNLAEEIRKSLGKATRAQRDATHELLVAEREKNRKLWEENSSLLNEVRTLASRNEALVREIAVLKAVRAGNVVPIR